MQWVWLATSVVLETFQAAVHMRHLDLTTYIHQIMLMAQTNITYMRGTKTYLASLLFLAANFTTLRRTRQVHSGAGNVLAAEEEGHGLY